MPHQSQTAVSAVVLTGEIDLANAEDVRERILAAAGGGVAAVHVDMQGVTFFDSSGVQALVSAHTDLAARGVTLAVGAMSPQVERILELTGLRGRLGFPTNGAASRPVEPWAGQGSNL